MSGNDSSSEDDDYKPSNREIREADADAKKQKRKRPSEGEAALGKAKRAPDPEAALRALAAAKAAVAGVTENADGQISVMETRRFAGKNIQVSKLATAAEAEEHKEKEAKKSGIDAVLASLEAAKKVNVLDKSRDDWGQFKKTDAEIERELDEYNKSGGKYLDKVDFLKRAELREYEAERDSRLAGDIRSRGRV